MSDVVPENRTTMTDRIQTQPDPAMFRTPFRVLPSRVRDLTGSVIILLVGATLAAIGMALAVGGPAQHDGLAAILLLLGIVGGLYGGHSVRHEMRHFTPGAEYWIEITPDHFGLITPDVAERCPWSDIRGFEVVTTEHRRKSGQLETFYDAIVRYRRYDLEIDLDDFATGLGKDDKTRAESLCSALNELRARAIASAGEQFSYSVPAGIVATEAMAPRPKPKLSVASVVMRQ